MLYIAKKLYILPFMNLRQLQVLTAIAHTGSFSAAGAQIGLAQPAVSLAIKKLETELGLELFHREGKSVRFTQAGEILLAHARAIQVHLSQSREAIQALRGLQTGRVRFGAPAIIAGHWLPPALADFVRRYPGVHLQQCQAGAEVIAAQVRNGELDFGIIGENVPGMIAGMSDTSNELETIPLLSLRLVAAVQRGSPLDTGGGTLGWEALFEQRLLLFPRGYHARERVEELARQRGLQLIPAIEAEAAALLCALTAQGLGVSILLEVATTDIPGIAIRPLADDPHVAVSLCRRRAGVLTPAAQALWSQLIAYGK